MRDTHFTTTVPPAEDFVRETRPPDDKLTYQPLYGSRPNRPAARTPAEVKDLQAELEVAGARNAARAGHHAKPDIKPKHKPHALR